MIKVGDLLVGRKNNLVFGKVVGIEDNFFQEPVYVVEVVSTINFPGPCKFEQGTVDRFFFIKKEEESFTKYFD